MIFRIGLHWVDLLIKLHIDGEDDFRECTVKCITGENTPNLGATMVGAARKNYVLTLWEA